MEYWRGRPSDDRRRRVMLDDSRLASEKADGAAADESDAKPSRKSAKSYPDDALANRQMRLTDLLPKNAWAVLALFAVVILAAAGVHFAHLQREPLSTFFGPPSYIFDVKEPGSLGHGLSVLLVAGATLASYLIYSLRRHKMDDYRGHYGIWLWVALALTCLTLSEYTGATGLAEAVVQRNAPVGLLSRWPLIVHTIVALGALLFLARLGAEMQRCRLALAVLALLVGAVGVVVALEAGWRPNAIDWPEELLAFHSRLASRGLLFGMLIVYGRHTRLDALGTIKVRERKPKKKAKSEAAKVEAKSEAKLEPKPAKPIEPVKTSAPAPAPVKPAAPVRPATITAPKPVLTLGQKPNEAEDDENAGSGRLSRAERRRLKQLGKAA